MPVPAPVNPYLNVPLFLNPRAFTFTHIITVIVVLLSSLLLGIVISLVYKGTHRGLSYSQAFQFSLVLLNMLGATIMMVASTGVLPAIGIFGGLALIRFRTPVKDPKDMAYILFTLVVGLAMGAELYYLGVLATVIVCLVIITLTRLNFGLSYSHEAIIRLTCVGEEGQPLDTAMYDSILEQRSQDSHLLSAVGHGNRMELTYGFRPKRGVTRLAVMEELRRAPAVEHAEMFDAKHQVEF